MPLGAWRLVPPTSSNESNASDAYNALTMATLTIRNLDEPLKTRLRIRAASRNRSMEEEARQILRAALEAPTTPVEDLGARIRARFAGLGDVHLVVEAREPVRSPPVFAASAASPRKRKPAERNVEGPVTSSKRRR